MNPKEIAALVNIVGFITGAALYAMLLAMVLGRGGRRSNWRLETPSDRLLLATGFLGLLWNAGALVIYGLRDLSLGEPPWLAAAAFTALGFLPAVVVDSALWPAHSVRRSRAAWMLMALAYGLSAVASGMHFYAATVEGAAPSASALQALTFGFAALIVALVVLTPRGWGRAVWAVALAFFAVSALHLSQHRGGESWWIELVGHHASIPLALAILYQDYRFALADLFLKRALALLALVALASGLYVGVASPMLARGDSDLRAIGALLGLWVGTALVYPALRRGASRFVDAVVLRRADYDEVRAEVAQLLARGETPEAILDGVSARLQAALTSREVTWMAEDLGPAGRLAVVRPAEAAGEARARLETLLPHFSGLTAALVVPVTDPPHYVLAIGPLGGGRRLLSDDLALLEAVSLLVARRIDAWRVSHERCERDLREQQISQLAAEAELRALRAQLNPHFLFNALTTIGYLIQTAPERALETLIDLTGLLRGVLRRAGGESTTLGEELDLISSYLSIEKARFEERLRVTIEVPAELRSVRIPPLVLQPLVENAVKHGIAPCRAGGDLLISARPEADGHVLVAVIDTGAGANADTLACGRARGVGLANVERRLVCYYGADARFEIESAPGAGTSVRLRVPVEMRRESPDATPAPTAELFEAARPGVER